MKPIHPIALCYPPMKPEGFAALVADIRTHGLLEPITLLEDKVLDGNHRQQACEAAGVMPRYENVSAEIDPYAFVVSKNQHRRHLTTGQKGCVAAKIATLKRGSNQYAPKVDQRIRRPKQDASKRQSAKLLGVGVTTVAEAQYVMEKGIPALYDALQNGKVKAYRAKEIAQLPKDQQLATLTAELAGKRPKIKTSGPKSSETVLDRQRKMHANLSGVRLRELTQEEIDPNFKGSQAEFRAKYGHVNLRTKAEIEAEANEFACRDWVAAIKELEKPLAMLLSLPAFPIEEFRKWLSTSKDGRRTKQMLGHFDLLQKAAKSIDPYLNLCLSH